MMARIGMAAGAAALALPALAQDSGRPADRALAPFVACRPLADPRARALCYDAALDRLQQAVAERQVVIVQRDERRAVLSLPATSPRAAPVLPARIDSTIVSATVTGYDRWIIRIASGTIWRTTESGLSVVPRPGLEINIRRGALGGYLMQIGKGRSVRAERIG